jgi:hypothetical protein
VCLRERATRRRRELQRVTFRPECRPCVSASSVPIETVRVLHFPAGANGSRLHSYSYSLRVASTTGHVVSITSREHSCCSSSSTSTVRRTEYEYEYKFDFAVCLGTINGETEQVLPRSVTTPIVDAGERVFGKPGLVVNMARRGQAPSWPANAVSFSPEVASAHRQERPARRATPSFHRVVVDPVPPSFTRKSSAA